VFNLQVEIVNHPDRYRQLLCGESLMSMYNCPLENKYEDTWSHHNYIVYVVEGRKIWHTSHGSYDLQKGSCVFVRKGASIVEQFFDVRFCLILFFLPDDFIRETLKQKSDRLENKNDLFDPVIAIDPTAAIHAYFQSMMPYFNTGAPVDRSLLELKFKELVLLLADHSGNGELHAFFNRLFSSSQGISLRQVMEENFCFNLKLEEYAKLSSRSLSAFKRDFQNIFKISPGKWLLEKRLSHAMHLLHHAGKTVSEAAFESGFMNISHFSRAFRNRFGTSPAAVKQQVAG